VPDAGRRPFPLSKQKKEVPFPSCKKKAEPPSFTGPSSFHEEPRDRLLLGNSWRRRPAVRRAEALSPDEEITECPSLSPRRASTFLEKSEESRTKVLFVGKKSNKQGESKRIYIIDRGEWKKYHLFHRRSRKRGDRSFDRSLLTRLAGILEPVFRKMLRGPRSFP